MHIDVSKFVQCNKRCQVSVGCKAANCVESATAMPGQTNLVLCMELSAVVSEISRYMDLKSQSPDSTDAYLICPKVPNVRNRSLP